VPDAGAVTADANTVADTPAVGCATVAERVTAGVCVVAGVHAGVSAGGGDGTRDGLNGARVAVADAAMVLSTVMNGGTVAAAMDVRVRSGVRDAPGLGVSVG
jgi:hypothetical protein